MIFEIYIWVLSFISVFIAVLWIIVNFTSKVHRSEEVKIKKHSKITVVVPVWNEEGSIIPTLNSILNQNYRLDLLEIIVVDDCSTDETCDIVKKFVSDFGYKNITLIKHNKNLGKGGALNTALKKAEGEFFWVYDADSLASKDLLNSLLERFYEKENSDVAAVIAITLIQNQGKWIEKMQRLEYVMTAFGRKLLGSVDTLHITNALTLFKTNILRKVGGFDQGNLTEDFEIAMKLRYNGYRIVMSENGSFYTKVPNTIKKMWMQRVRWFRGFIYNNLKYRKMIMNKKFGLLGLFQIPLEVFFLLIIFVSLIIFGYHIIQSLINLGFQIYIQRFALLEFTVPTIKQIILDFNWKIVFPSIVVLVFGMYLYLEAHRYVRGKWRFYIPSLLYLFVYPLFRSFQWIHALVLELGRAERKW